MSIIYDALKKVEKSNQLRSGPELNKHSKHRLNLKIYLLFSLIISLGFFIANFFFNVFMKPQIVSKPDTEPDKELLKEKPLSDTSSSAQNQVLIQSEKQPAKLSQPSLTLNGVFFSENTGYVLINNRILKEGEVIEGAKVCKISLDEIELEFEGKPIKLYNK